MYYTNAEARFVYGTLSTHSNLDEEVAESIGRRVDLIKNECMEKMADLMNGDTEEYGYQTKTDEIMAIGEMSMFYTDGDLEKAVEITKTSKITTGVEDEYPIKSIVRDSWEGTGCGTYKEGAVCTVPLPDQDRSDYYQD